MSDLITFFVMLLFAIFILSFAYSVHYKKTYGVSKNFDDSLFGKCEYRRFGCCTDGITNRLDEFGSNCRGF